MGSKPTIINMNVCIKSTLAASMLYISITGPVWAGLAAGNYTFNGGTYLPVWDLSGSYSNNLGGGTYVFSLAQSPSGQLTGSGSLLLEESYGFAFAYLAGSVTNTGSISGTCTNPVVTLNLTAEGSGVVLGLTVFDFTETANLKLGINGANATLTGSGSVVQTQTTPHARAQTQGVSQPLSGVQIPLPANVTGGWQMSLNLTSKRNNYTGTARVTTSAGSTENFTVTGSYAPATDVSSLTLKGSGGSVTLVIKTAGSQLTLRSIKGTLFGQTVNFKAK